MSKCGKVTLVDLDMSPLFGNIKCGQFFVIDGSLCVRISEGGDGEWAALNFKNNKIFHLPHNTRVSLVEVEIFFNRSSLTRPEWIADMRV